MRVLLLIMLVIGFSKDALPLDRFITDGPVSQVFKDGFLVHGMMRFYFEEGTILYNKKGERVDLRNLKRGDFVTVIFIEKGKRSLAEEIYIHPVDGGIRFSKKAKAWLKKAGIIIYGPPSKALREETERPLSIPH